MDMLYESLEAIAQLDGEIAELFQKMRDLTTERRNRMGVILAQVVKRHEARRELIEAAIEAEETLPYEELEAHADALREGRLFICPECYEGTITPEQKKNHIPCGACEKRSDLRRALE